jgi:hypothetical protein
LKQARAFLRTSTGAAIVAGLACAAAAPAEARVSEAEVKAAYLYKLASFVQWPPTAFADATAPLRICVAGRSDIYDVVEGLTRDQEASGRRLMAQAVDAAKPETAAQCQILFIGRGEAAARALLSQAGQRPILTVTDRTGGTRGGIIEFVVADGNIRFSIHRRAAEARQLELSSKLLAVAESIEP